MALLAMDRVKLRRMPIQAILARYGLVGIFLGAGIEGEAVVVAGGVIAHHGLVPLWAAAGAAAAGSCIVDQLWFIAGRRYREHRWVRKVTNKPAFARALRILERYPTGFIFAFRFIYGLRTVSPIAIGTSSIPASRFVPLNIAAAAIWGPAFTLIGYRLGKAAEPLLARFAEYGLAAATTLAAAALLFLGLRKLHRRAG